MEFVDINPLSNMNMITGIATIGVEIIDERPETEAIIVPVGGGGLISGVAIGAKHKKSDVKIYGVQTQGANAVYRSIKEGKIVELEKVETIADGLAVKKPNEQAIEFIKQYVDDVVLVSDDEVKQAIFLLLERGKLVVEPAGATAMAGVLNARIASLKDREVVVVLTGGNIDFQLLKSLL